MIFGGVLRAALTNERLFLMGLTSLALSLASGWTTFEGMTNFTKSPVLCFLITFGVQGIMLVSAWMIGEALISLRHQKGGAGGENVVGELFSKVFAGPATILKVWLIWMVFLFSMAISVFFSFDSLFSSIFSEEERRRAGEIRTQSEVGSVLSDLKKRVETRKFEAIDQLFPGVGRLILKELVQLRHRRRQSGQIKIQPSRQRGSLRVVCGTEVLLRPFRFNPAIDPCARPARIRHRRAVTLRRPEGPLATCVLDSLLDRFRMGDFRSVFARVEGAVGQPGLKVLDDVVW